MKRFKFLAFLLAIIAGVSFFASCGGDDDDDNNGGTNSSIVGTWKQTHSWGYETLTFKKDGTGIATEVDNYYSYGDTDVEEFKWSLKGDVLTISYWEEPYYNSYSSYEGGWDTERFKVVSVDDKSLVLKHLPDDDDSYYYSDDEYSVWARQ